MRNALFLMSLAALGACGGGEKPAAPATVEPAKVEEPATEAPKPAAEPAPDFATATDEVKMAWLMKAGEVVYNTGGSGGVACVTCHQATGEGLPGAFPPIKGSKDFMGDCKKHAKIVKEGLSGEIVVQGVTFNGAMPAQAIITDLEIAAVITYERNSWGNDYGLCTPADLW